MSAHPLDLMLAKKSISMSAYIAGLRFRSDWELAHVSGEGTTDWDRFAPAPLEDADEPTFRRGYAKPVRGVPSSLPAQRYDAKAALENLRQRVGAFGWELLRAVCVMGIGLSHIGDALGIHRDYVSLRLREALDEAAAFYGPLIDDADRAP